MTDFHRARRVPPRRLWGREDTEFTPWLEENIDYLNEELDISLTVTEREQDTPSGFSIDLAVTEEDSGRDGVIECQIEESDHDHLGKLLAYTTSFDSEVGLWIVRSPRYEHKKTIEWLNEGTEKYFYLVQIEGIEVDGELAPLFTPVVVPSPAAKEIGEKKREPKERELKQEQFWTELLERSEGEFDLFSNVSPKQQGRISKSAGKSGVKYRYRLRNDWADVGLYINTRTKEKNEEIFHQLKQQSEEIEESFGEELNWLRLEDKNACRIVYQVTDRGLNNEDEWEEIQEEMLEHMQRVYQAFDDPISSL